MRVVLTPGGRFLSVASAARYHKVNVVTVLRRIRKGRPGGQFEAPYQIPAGFVQVLARHGASSGHASAWNSHERLPGAASASLGDR